MNFEYKHFLPVDFSASSRVWIYQSSRSFSTEEISHLKVLLDEFVAGWKSHGTPVKGFANLFFNQFIILLADETATGVSGCSTDSSVHLIKQIEERFSVDMFNRQTLAFIINDKVELMPLTKFSSAIKNDFINPDTLYFNNLISTREDLENNWIIPEKNSWLAKKLNLERKTGLEPATLSLGS